MRKIKIWMRANATPFKGTLMKNHLHVCFYLTVYMLIYSCMKPCLDHWIRLKLSPFIDNLGIWIQVSSSKACNLQRKSLSACKKRIGFAFLFIALFIKAKCRMEVKSSVCKPRASLSTVRRCSDSKHFSLTYIIKRYRVPVVLKCLDSQQVTAGTRYFRFTCKAFLIFLERIFRHNPDINSLFQMTYSITETQILDKVCRFILPRPCKGVKQWV